jgi:hypothetical protein
MNIHSLRINSYGLGKLLSFRLRILLLMVNKINKANPVTDHGSLERCEMTRFPHLPDNRLANGGEVVSLTPWPLFTLQEVSWYLFMLKIESNPEI